MSDHPTLDKFASCDTCGVQFRLSRLYRDRIDLTGLDAISPTDVMDYRDRCQRLAISVRQQCPVVIEQVMMARLEEANRRADARSRLEREAAAAAILKMQELERERREQERISGILAQEREKERLRSQKIKAAERAAQLAEAERKQRAKTLASSRAALIAQFKSISSTIVLRPIVLIVLFMSGLSRLAYTNTLGFISVFGMTATFLASIEWMIVLAGWARIFLEFWREWTFLAWLSIFAIFHIDIPYEAASILTHVFFIMVMGLSSTERFVLAIKRFTDSLRVTSREQYPESLVLSGDDYGVDRSTSIVVYAISYLMIAYSSIYGALRKIAGGNIAAIADRLAELYVGLLIGISIVSVTGALWICHQMAHRGYLVERFKTFLTLVVTFLILNYISVYSDSALEFFVWLKWRALER